MQPTRRGKLASWTLSREKVPERDQETISSTQKGRSDDPESKDNKAMQGSRRIFDSTGSCVSTKVEVSGYLRATKQTLSSLLQRPTDMRW